MGFIAADGKVAFVHIPKTGGWSVKTWLADIFEVDDTDPQEMLRRQGFPIGHVRLADFEHYLKRPLDSFEKIIAVIRDPYSRELSQWKYWWERRARGGTHIHDYVAGQYNNLTAFLADPRSQFHIWYKQHHEHPAVPQYLQYRDVGGFYNYFLEPFPGNLEVVRMEDMARDLPEIIKPFTDKPLPPLPHTNDSAPVRRIQDWYTGEACRIVNERYARTWSEGWYNQWALS